MSAPSSALENSSTLSCPKACSSSGGASAARSVTSATTAATRFTPDSRASESRPTDPVSAHATAFNPIVSTAAAIDSHA